MKNTLAWEVYRRKNVVQSIYDLNKIHNMKMKQFNKSLLTLLSNPHQQILTNPTL